MKNRTLLEIMKIELCSRIFIIAVLAFPTQPLRAQFNCSGVRFYQVAINKTFLSNTHTEILVQPTDSIGGFALARADLEVTNWTDKTGYEITKRIQVELKIYDIRGREIVTLMDSIKSPGTYELRWNGEDSSGAKVTSGTYLYRLKAGNSIQTKKLSFVK